MNSLKQYGYSLGSGQWTLLSKPHSPKIKTEHISARPDPWTLCKMPSIWPFPKSRSGNFWRWWWCVWWRWRVSSRGNGHSKVYTGVATLYPGHHIRLPRTTKELATPPHFYSIWEAAIPQKAWNLFWEVKDASLDVWQEQKTSSIPSKLMCFLNKQHFSL